MRQKGKEWITEFGKTVPTYAINPVLKLEEKHAQRVINKALQAEKKLEETVEAVINAYNEIYDAKIKDANMKGNKKVRDGMTFNSLILLYSMTQHKLSFSFIFG